MDAVTGLSASGPAYIYIIIESLAEAGVKVGYRAISPPCWRRRLLWERLGWYFETGDHPALLKDAVTTPAGCTVDGIMELEKASCE